MSFTELNFTLETVKDRLGRQAIAIDALCQVDLTQASWKPSPEEWSILEVICHLYDEEKEDFRVRLANLLSNPENEWDAINPEAWVIERDYASQNHLERLGLFLTERQKSILWLTTLIEPLTEPLTEAKWQNTKTHPELGSMTAEEMLFAWVAHDVRHIQQLSRLHYAYLREHCSDAILYAG